MFKKSRQKIVAVIMSILVLLWVGTLAVIYSSSYLEIKNQNEQMLQTHAQMFTLSPSAGGQYPEKPVPDINHGFLPGFDPDSPRFQLSTFYTVAVSYYGKVIEINNNSPAVHSDQDLAQFAERIIKAGKTTGREKNLSFLLTDKGGYYLVTFVDNTVVYEGATTLFRNTLVFGGAALILIFFLSRFLAGKIVAPLEESYQKQKQFISDAGHELKTPVSVVSANAEILSRQIGDNPWLQNIQYENERMGILVGRLLELARTESVTPQMEHLDLSRLVAGEALPFESIAFENNMVLRCDITNGITVEGDSAQLKQLAAILLDNAIRHSKAEGEIRLTLAKEHGIAQLSVINPGDEIPGEHRDRLFERFYRADPARNGEDKHYGLGLAIAKAIVDAHHGHIGVRCRDGQVEFLVRLPVTKEK